MSDEYDRGPLSPYEVVWRSGYREIIHAHQVLLPRDDSFSATFASALGIRQQERKDVPRITMHGEIEGKWQLLLHADAQDILSIKRIFTEETAGDPT